MSGHFCVQVLGSLSCFWVEGDIHSGRSFVEVFKHVVGVRYNRVAFYKAFWACLKDITDDSGCECCCVFKRPLTVFAGVIDTHKEFIPLKRLKVPCVLHPQR